MTGVNRNTFSRYSQYSSLILILLMWGFFLLAHWLACIWYVIAEKELESSLFSTYNRGWMSMLAVQSHYNDTRCVPDSEAYITALYFTCTSLTTVGFGNVSANTKAIVVHCIVATQVINQSYQRLLNITFAWWTTKYFSMKKYLPS